MLLWWAYLVLGSNLPWLLAAIGVTVIAVWLLRDHRAVAACVAIGAMTRQAVPAVTCVILIDRQVTGATDTVAVLTGYILAAPVPALLASALRPALVTVPVNALLGSGVLLLGAASGVALGDHGEGAAVLITALTLSVGLIRYRHRRAATALLAALPLVNGWTDLGRRALPDGSRDRSTPRRPWTGDRLRDLLHGRWGGKGCPRRCPGRERNRGRARPVGCPSATRGAPVPTGKRPGRGFW